MRNNRTAKLVIAAALLAGFASADVKYTDPTNNDWVDFSVTGCGSGGCTLLIGLDDTAVSPNDAALEISGVTFTLSNNGTNFSALASSLANSGSMYHSYNSTTQVLSGAVTVWNSGTTTTNTAPSRWKLQNNSNTGTFGSGEFSFTTLSGGSPVDLIDGSGTPTGSASQHAPVLEGPVYFEIVDVPGLTSSSVISSVSLNFGTTPDSSANLPVTDCTVQGGLGVCGGGIEGSTPEPMSFLLAGAGLIGLACMRRRLPSAN